MRIISEKKLRQYSAQHPDSAASLARWLQAVKAAEWRNLTDVRAIFSSADVVGRVVVFNIAGNHHRLIASIHYNTQLIYVLEIMSHAEYSKENWKTRYAIDS